MKKRKLVIVTALVLVPLGASLAGCSTPGSSGMHGSRAELYDSVQGLAADSSIAAVVEVQSQQVLNPASDRDFAYTLSTVSVVSTLSPKGLASELPANVPTDPVSDGSEIVVRQMGTVDIETPAPILKAGEQYLLFLVPSMLEGEAASQFWVTGGSAGVYEVSGDDFARGSDATFTHGPFEEGDTLPPTLTAKDLTQ
jgi:hypothetical protein